MEDFSEVDTEVLRKYPRCVVHLRRQRKLKRLGLVFGSGLSKSFGMPTWEELVTSIAADQEVDGCRILKCASKRDNLPMRLQLLFEHFKRRSNRRANPDQAHSRQFEAKVSARWVQILHRHLYKSAPKDIPRAVVQHPYLSQYLPIIRESHMTVNYNFDDMVEQALMVTMPEKERMRSRGFESVSNASLQFRREDRIIYHPNGFLPSALLDMPSKELVLSEGAFADQLIESFFGSYASLLHYLSKNTCVFIGLSLADSTLRNLLRQNARLNPGHFHYYVRHTTSRDSLDEESLQATTRAHFEVFNLITLFLDDKGISALGRSMTVEEDALLGKMKRSGIPHIYRYYVTGALGAGKSTALEYFRNVNTYDEWYEPRLEIMAKPWDDLDEEEREEIDRWVARQFRLKNDNLSYQRCGIHLVDRAPLDPLVFTPKSDWSKKAARLLTEMTEGAEVEEAQPGRVILLVGNEDELVLRLVPGQEGYTAAKIRTMQETYEKLYSGLGVVRIETQGLGEDLVVRRIAEAVHLDPYQEFDIQGRLEEVRKRGSDVLSGSNP